MSSNSELGSSSHQPLLDHEPKDDDTISNYTTYDEENNRLLNNSETDLELNRLPRTEGEGGLDSGIPTDESLDSFIEVDHPDLPCFTFRFWVLSITFGTLLAFTNQFFFFRATPLGIGGFVIQLLTYPIGVFLANVLPDTKYSMFGTSFSLNPGPFNVKEHVLITVCAGACAGTAYAMDIIVVKRLYYKEPFSILAALLLMLSSQFIGYGFAGLYRRFLVRPKSMVWPGTLVAVSVFRALHQGDTDMLASGKQLRKFFAVAALLSFVYYFLPGYLFTTLASVSILCLALPNSQIAHQLGSGVNGLGLGALSFDWNAFTSYIGSPLVTPFWAQVNTIIGFVLVCWIIVPVGYYMNLWDALKFPIFTANLYDVEGHKYDRIRITPNHKFSQLEYDAYSPVRLSFFFSFTYGVSFATLTALITHTILYHGPEILARIKDYTSNRSEDDVHVRLMAKYPEVPSWWYFLVFVISLSLAIVVTEFYELTLPWWGLLVAVAISFLFTLPIGIITAITNQSPGLNVLTEFVAGYMFPGLPIANVTFKVYGFITMLQSLNFLADLKLGHYLKVPPRHMFIAQVVGTALAVVVQLATSELMMKYVENICTPAGYPWTCPSTEVFYSASVIWGLIGPAKMFGPDSVYFPLLYSFLIGLFLPIPFYLLQRIYPNSLFKYVHIPIIVSATAVLPPARPGNFLSWFLVGFLFHVIIKKANAKWYNKFTLILSAALDTGVAFAALVIFFAFQLHPIVLNWWGNDPNFHCPLADKPGLETQ